RGKPSPEPACRVTGVAKPPITLPDVRFRDLRSPRSGIDSPRRQPAGRVLVPAIQLRHTTPQRGSRARSRGTSSAWACVFNAATAMALSRGESLAGAILARPASPEQIDNEPPWPIVRSFANAVRGPRPHNDSLTLCGPLGRTEEIFSGLDSDYGRPISLKWRR